MGLSRHMTCNFTVDRVKQTLFFFSNELMHMENNFNLIWYAYLFKTLSVYVDLFKMACNETVAKVLVF